jgi:4-carboxymuconolactone decarboxylase
MSSKESLNPTPPRLAPPAPAQMSERQRAVRDAIASGPRGGVRGPLAVWLHRPELADRAQALGKYCRFEMSLPARLRELAILTTARVWGSEFEWWSHKPLALEAGISPAAVDAIRRGAEPVFERDDEAIVYAFALALHRDRRVGDALYRRAADLLGAPAVVDLTGLLGYYTLISMTINVFAVPLPEGAAPEL